MRQGWTHSTFDGHFVAVVPSVGAVRAGSVALVLALVVGPELLDRQADPVPRVPLHPHLAIPHARLVGGVGEAVVPGGHHSDGPVAGFVLVQEPLKVLRPRALVLGHGAGQRQGEARHAEQRSGGEGHVATHGALEHCGE